MAVVGRGHNTVCVENVLFLLQVPIGASGALQTPIYVDECTYNDGQYRDHNRNTKID